MIEEVDSCVPPAGPVPTWLGESGRCGSRRTRASSEPGPGGLHWAPDRDGPDRPSQSAHSRFSDSDE